MTRLLFKLLDTLSIYTESQITNKYYYHQAYGIELWASFKSSTFHQFQLLKSNFFRKLSHLPFYVLNSIIHRDLNIPLFRSYGKTHYRTKHCIQLNRPNHLPQSLNNYNILFELKLGKIKVNSKTHFIKK